MKNRHEKRSHERGRIFKNEQYGAMVQSYTKSTPKELQEGGFTREILKKSLSDEPYEVDKDNIVLRDYVGYIRENYKDWQDYTRNQNKDSCQIEYFMRTPEYLSIVKAVLRGGNVLALDCLR